MRIEIEGQMVTASEMRITVVGANMIGVQKTSRDLLNSVCGKVGTAWGEPSRPIMRSDGRYEMDVKINDHFSKRARGKRVELLIADADQIDLNIDAVKYALDGKPPRPVDRVPLFGILGILEEIKKQAQGQ